MFMYSWNYYSKSSKDLARRLGIKRIKHHHSRFIGRPSKTVINWGASEVRADLYRNPIPEEVMKCSLVNHPDLVRNVTNKHSFLLIASEHCRVPPFTTDIKEVKEWLTKSSVCARMILNGSGGRGIVYIAKGSTYVPVAPLYTKYIPKMSEFRVHIFWDHGAMAGVIVDIQRKARRLDVDDTRVDWHIRNLDNGFIYARNELDCPNDVIVQAREAFKCTGLDFGAVDVVWNEQKQEAYVLEINTAPGLQGTTLDTYVDAIRRYI